MNRRTYLRTAALTPVAFSQSGAAAETDPDDSELLDDIGHRYFAALANADQDSEKALVGCANAICEHTALVREETFESLRQGIQAGDDGIRQARFAVRFLNEYRITDVVTESELLRRERRVRSVSRYLPLLGSFNNLRATACTVSEDNPETIEQFLYASLAFGIEVGLWHTGAPFKMAWNGTRFVANRSFLRYARNGCRSCVAFLMSELHWAQRDVLHMAVSEDSITFVVNELSELERVAKEDLETEEDYSAYVDFTEEEIVQIISKSGEEADRVMGGGGIFVQEPQSPIESILSSIESYIPLLFIAFIAFVLKR